MARIFTEADGSRYAILEDGSKMPFPEELTGEVVPHDIVQESGTTLGERVLLKNLASNVPAARKWLEARGYETRPLNTSGLNFAVRHKGDTGPWKVLDPDTGVFGKDFVGDLLDLSSDAILTGLTVGAGLGTGGVGAGALAAGGGELLREGVGSLAGIEDNIDPYEIGAQTAIGGAVPAIGKGLGAAGRAIAGSRPAKALGTFTLEGAAKIAGVKELVTEAGVMSPGQVLKARALEAAKSLPSVKQVAQKLQGMVRSADSRKFHERIWLDKMLDRASENGVTVDLRPAMNHLKEAAFTEVSPEMSHKIAREASLPTEAASQIKSVITTIADSLKIPIDEVDLSKVPANVADKIQADLRYHIDKLRGFASQQLPDARPQLTSVLKAASKHMRQSIEETMNPIVGTVKVLKGGRAVDMPKFTYAYSRLADKTSSLTKLAKAVGAFDKKDPQAALKRAITFVRQTAGDASSIEALRNFEREFGRGAARGAESQVNKSMLGEAFGGRGSRGVPKGIARFSAVGQPLGMSMLGSAGLGYAAGGPIGAGVGLGTLAGASAAFSPRSILGATRIAESGVIGRGLGRINKGAQAAAIATLQQAARLSSAGSKGLASESYQSKPKRKARFTGGG